MSADQQEKSGLHHVGGVSEDIGGVDPFADENMMRLFLF